MERDWQEVTTQSTLNQGLEQDLQVFKGHLADSLEKLMSEPVLKRRYSTGKTILERIFRGLLNPESSHGVFSDRLIPGLRQLDA